ncbi:patatin-like phospholipase family protein [Nocardia sp. R6R-6]|uniref:patatin-like phospholipase family protein n=1 Tax=Nocardia sp. R6R-6 TaxID=3459303 RepID=UPI00403E191C
MPYADLVLEGGGVKGIAFVGAIEVLQERGYEFRRVAGTSAGAIVGTLVAAGYSAGELVSIMRSVDYRKFQDGDFMDRFAFGKALGLLFEQGIYDGNYLEEWLNEHLAQRGKRTFADFEYNDDERPLPPDKQYSLVVMASDISHGRLSRLPWQYDRYGRDRGTQQVADAVRASMSIPFFYTPVQWNTTGGEKSWLVDGGLLSNFPIDVFDAPGGTEPRWPTLGIKLSAKPDAAQGNVNKITNTISMGKAILNTLTGFYDRIHLDDPGVVARTIFVDTGKIKATDFDLSPADQDMLYKNGRAAATKFLDGTDTRPPWNFSKYIATYRT